MRLLKAVRVGVCFHTDGANASTSWKKKVALVASCTSLVLPTCICVFPPWRRAMPSRMLSSNTRSFLVLTMRSITSSEAPTLSNRHWISTILLPGLSESSMGELPAEIKLHVIVRQTDTAVSLMQTMPANCQTAFFFFPKEQSAAMLSAAVSCALSS